MRRRAIGISTNGIALGRQGVLLAVRRSARSIPTSSARQLLLERLSRRPSVSARGRASRHHPEEILRADHAVQGIDERPARGVCEPPRLTW